MRAGEKTAIKTILKNAVQSEMPSDVLPMHFKIAHAAFDNDAWQFEIKWDGFWLLSYNQQREVALRSRTISHLTSVFLC